MTIDLDELEAKAKAATPYTDIADVMGAACMGGDVWLDSEKGVTEFASAANPAVMLELVRRLRAAEARALRHCETCIDQGCSRRSVEATR